MLGAIIGDVVGSIYEFHNHRDKDFPFFSQGCRATDDSVMTCAIASAILSWDREGRQGYGRLSELAAEEMRVWGKCYPRAGYGGRFRLWLADDSMGAYGSCGNGSAMRVSPVGWAANTLEECIAMAEAVSVVTHDHPDGIKGAVATATQIFLLRQGEKLSTVEAYEKENFYAYGFSLADKRKAYQGGVCCFNTCPEAFQCVYEAKDYEDAIRNSISLGGDSDTIAAIAGGIAEAAFGIPEEIGNSGKCFLDDKILTVLSNFSFRFATK